MRKISIILDGGAGELDRRDIEIPSAATGDQAAEAIRAAVIELADCSILTPGDTIKIEEG